MKQPKNPLVCQKPLEDGPILTVEHTGKWYDVWVLYPDGKIQELDLYAFATGTAWNDHVPHPEACMKAAATLQIPWDGNSLEMIIGRWMLEVRSDELELIAKIKNGNEVEIVHR